jgi:hypothetical protein
VQARGGDGVKIRYENTLEDLVAFNRYHADHSPDVRRARVRFLAVVLALMLPVGIAGVIAVEEPILKLVVVALGVVGAALAVVTAPGQFRRSLEREVRHMYREGANKGAVGTHELELTGDEVVERTPFSELRTRLPAVERVVSDGGYTFIYVGTAMAHVIPHRAVSAGDPEALVQALKQRMSPGLSQGTLGSDATTPSPPEG